MKLFNKIAIGLAVMGMGINTACTDLTPEIYSDVMIDDYYQTPAQFATLIANAYSQLAGEHGYVYREGYWSMQEYTGDGVVVPTRGTDWYDAGVPIAMHQHKWEFNTRDINNGWSFAYGGVTKCNDVLKKIVEIKGEGPYDAATKAGVAEAKTLRAFYHLLAMDLYGNVTFDDGSGAEIKQYTRTEMFNKIESELLDAVNDLDSTRRYGSMTLQVANTILAKMYLNAEVYTGTAQWQKALDYCNKVIESGQYALSTDYFDTFKVDNTNNKEIIFPLVFDEVYAKGNMFHLMTLHYVHQDIYGLKTPPWNGPCTLGAYYDMYDAKDKRREQWFVGPVTDDAGKVLTYKHAESTVDAIFTKDLTTISDASGANSFEGARFIKFELESGIEHHANSDFPIYRYADILLMKAEAALRLGDEATAVAAANEVRKRTGLADYTSLTLDELLDERGRELAWEGHRRQDLIRFGKFTAAWQFKEQSEPFREIFPIPEWVITANPGVYTQNSGY